MVKLKVGTVILALGGVIILSALAVKHLQKTSDLLSIVPLPQRVEMHRGSFRLRPTTCIVVDPSCRSIGELLAGRLRQSTGYDIPLRSLVTESPESGTILITTKTAAELGPEGYQLDTTVDLVVIRAKEPAGLFYGTQSFLQLFPPQIFSKNLAAERIWAIPCLHIQDQPRFRWRGLMLDVSRHFFSPAEIKRLIDVMALHKLNIFHWHLTDDQGWRIEIKKYPRLTEVSAWRKSVGFNLDPKATTAYDAEGRYGGYYTQKDIKDIVAYAQTRFITIVPEIEMPGHSSAVLAAYPEFSCSGGPYTTDMTQAVSAGVFCAGQEQTFEFLQNVLNEVMDLFPGEFIHIGGDEVPKANWLNCRRCQDRLKHEGFSTEPELQNYFIRRIEKVINARGKRAIGWSEIWSADIATNSVIMDWIGGGVEAAQNGHDVVMSPDEYCYLDHYQSKDREKEPLAAGAYLPLRKVYNFEPVPKALAPAQPRHILGAQANVWTEYMPSLAQVEYMTLPRLSALAEVVWSPRQPRNWDDFLRRLRVQQQRFDQLGVKYRPVPSS